MIGEAVGLQDPRRIVGNEPHPAEDDDLFITGEFVEAPAKIGQGNIDRSRHAAGGKFRRGPYIEEHLFRAIRSIDILPGHDPDQSV